MRRTLLASVLLTILLPSIALGQQNTPTIYEPGEGVTAPSVVTSVEPTYTTAARAAGVQGFVFVEGVVLENGTIADAKVIQSRLWSSMAPRTNHRESVTLLTDAEVTKLGLDARAIAAAERWTFRPGTRDGTPVSVRITMEMRFTLQTRRQAR